MKKMILCFATLCFSVASFAQQEVRDTVIAGDGFRYEGKWPQGEGVLYSDKNGLIIGSFKGVVPDGKCINFKPNGDRYWGDFKNGKRTGHACEFKKKSPIVTTGDFVNGKKHGRDTIYRKDGSVIIGKYEKGKLVETVREFASTNKKLSQAKPVFPEIQLTDEQKAFISEIEAKFAEFVAEKKRIKENTIKPKFMGQDQNAFAEWVNARLRYPEDARKKGIEGAPVLQFTITAEGELTDIKVVRSSGNIKLDNEAIRVVSQSPDWTPGTQDGKAKDIKLTFPVIFKLN